MTTERIPSDFLPGDEVVLTRGTYPGTQGIFLGLREDTNWADIRERNGGVRSHPVAWLAVAGPQVAPQSRLMGAGREPQPIGVAGTRILEAGEVKASPRLAEPADRGS